MKAGDVFTDQNIRSIRPAHGLPPKYFPEVLDRRAARDLYATPLHWEDVTGRPLFAALHHATLETISMRVLVFTAHTTWKPHYETDLEIIQRHLDDGDEVVHLHCDADLPACDANPHREMATCRNCIGIRQSGMSSLFPKCSSISFLNLSQSNKRELASVQKTFATIAELKSFYVRSSTLAWRCFLRSSL